MASPGSSSAKLGARPSPVFRASPLVIMPVGAESGMARDPRQVVISFSVLASAAMLAGKLTAYYLTNSAALLADAAESVVHGAATGFAAFSLWFATRPADAGHPYGHGRIVYLSVGVEGTLVVATSVAVAYSGLAALLRGPELRHLGAGFSIAVVLAALNLTLAVFLISVGKRHRSMVILSNGKHVLTDVLTTGAAIIGVGLVMLTGALWLDPLAAIVIAVMIFVSGMTLVRRSIAGLMDRLDPALSGRLIECLGAAVCSGRIAGFHQLRCRSLEDEVWVDVHVLIPGELSLVEAHARATELEASMRSLLRPQSATITSHLEPVEHEGIHPAGHETTTDPLRANEPKG